MKTTTNSNRPRRRRLLGPGTILALILAAGIAITGRFANRPQVAPEAGRIVFEADEKGHMRRAGSPSASKTSMPILWKPEPGLLLEHSDKLHINPDQRTKIQSLNNKWLTAKAELEVEIGRTQLSAGDRVKTVDSGRNVTPAEITTNLQDYSQLSRHYNQLRADFWNKSVAVLSTAQQNQIADIQTTTGRTPKP
ncbi:MAG: hypothetical protein ABJA67_12315 [Chthonomonadales bacterium]